MTVSIVYNDCLYRKPRLLGWHAQVQEVGDGNINFVYIVKGPQGAVCLKQGLPFVRIAQDWPLTQVTDLPIPSLPISAICLPFRMIGLGWRPNSRRTKVYDNPAARQWLLRVETRELSQAFRLILGKFWVLPCLCMAAQLLPPFCTPLPLSCPMALAPPPPSIQTVFLSKWRT